MITTSRQDAWTPDEDLILAEIVLTHIREGSTQLKAFEEAGKKLKRTAAACGFRWNSNIRKKYAEEILLAKQLRKEAKNRLRKNSPEDHIPAMNEVSSDEQNKIAEYVAVLKSIENELLSLENIKVENHQLKQEIQKLKIEKTELENKIKDIDKHYQELQNEYHSLMMLLNKASQLAGQKGTNDMNT